MKFHALRCGPFASILCCGLLAGVMPARAETLSQARLVHCGAATCLRLSGHRSRPEIAVRIGGRDQAVEGVRQWRVTLPLATARAWSTAAGDSLAISLADPETGIERIQDIIVPPGALGRRHELATLVIRAR